MEETQIKTTLSVKITAALKRQGRSVVWLCNQLELSRPTYYDRLKNNTWSVGEIVKIKNLLSIGE